MLQFEMAEVSGIDAEENALWARVREGDVEARNQIVLKNIPTVKFFARRYAGGDVPYDDLFQEGCYGLLLAVEHFDPQRNVRFSTYASHYIEKYMKKAFVENGSSPGRYKEYYFYGLKAYIAAMDKFHLEQGRAPTDEELSKLTNMSVERIKRLKGHIKVFLSSRYTSDDSIGSGTGDISDFRSAEDEVFSHLDLKEFNAHLNSREEEVLRRRFGFTPSGEVETWPMISAATNLSINTLRAAYRSGLEKLRKSLGEG